MAEKKSKSAGSDSESKNDENEFYSETQENIYNENQQSPEVNQPAAVNGNFDELDGTSNSNAVRQQTADIGKPDSNIHQSESSLASADINTNQGFQSFQVSCRYPLGNEGRTQRQVTGLSERIEEIPTFVSSLTNANHNCPNTPGSVSIHSESQQLFGEDEFHQSRTTIPTAETSHCQPSDEGPSQMHIGSVPRVCNPNRTNSTDVSQNQNSFEGLPVMLADLPDTALFYNTCTIDTTLMIICYQFIRNRNLANMMTSSKYPFFNTELPSLVSLFMRRRFDEVRTMWARIIGHTSRRNFKDSDAYLINHPFSSFIIFCYRIYCNNMQCPLTEGRFYMPGVLFPRLPIGEYLNITTCQNLINNFDFRLEYPCTQTILGSREYDVLCGGQLTITRAANNALEQPPMIIINMGGSELRGRNIGDLNGTIEVCDYHYFIGGLTFAAVNHFTGRILLSNQGRTLFYCNAEGIRVLGENEEDLDYLNSLLSLVFLFRIM